MTKTSRAATSERGFSLVEIMIVIGLIALITAIGIPALNTAFRASNESFARKMAILLREARDRAMLTDKLIRLRLDLEKQQYWLEEAPSSYLMPKPPERGMSEREKEEHEEREKGAFRHLTELTKEKISLPRDLRITEVVSPRYKAPVTEGEAQIFFFNNGNADGATLRLEDEAEKVKMRITLHPVTGHSKFELGAGEQNDR